MALRWTYLTTKDLKSKAPYRFNETDSVFRLLATGDGLQREERSWMVDRCSGPSVYDANDDDPPLIGSHIVSVSDEFSINDMCVISHDPQFGHSERF
jgi:hypothetical protein